MGSMSHLLPEKYFGDMTLPENINRYRFELFSELLIIQMELKEQTVLWVPVAIRGQLMHSLLCKDNEECTVEMFVL